MQREKPQPNPLVHHLLDQKTGKATPMTNVHCPEKQRASPQIDTTIIYNLISKPQETTQK
ncbi:hypothetical protein CSUB_C0753 [Candidatus Caldarchaeum subterraneum]|uniref:Uncharacterized protein n=1 Tax=Caldiarchaeum subterraneum TaxID=311458 RepID=E6N609_CALS0|nr:hypothetical protein HGMM_F13A09C11 [Candidatus Caldarchaeum subterraneum]BAJ49434.1 hypothetical protein HGMM_F15D08C25 [Candidatus Caldarchaeum subterraneum]BAJ50611.1 hypothetical protein CSUB_C0753 [Candidatus Caldarchaeum subterraneum]